MYSCVFETSGASNASSSESHPFRVVGGSGGTGGGRPADDVVLPICFVDRAKEGSYNSRQPLLVTRYSATTYAVAINFEVDGCEQFAR